MTALVPIRGLSALADRYDAFILDQWGVLHNGSRPYPGAIDAVRAIAAAGKRMALLTNSGRRTTHNRARMTAMGFPIEAFAGTVTSGEAAWLALRNGDDPRLPKDLGKKAFLITRGGDKEVVDGLGIELVETPGEADFVFLTGVDSPPLTLDDFTPVIEAALARKLPMLCSNPDLVAVTSHGLSTAPGAVARRYEELGGKVYYFGKPNPPIYRACLRLLEGVPTERICCVGDSLEPDICGANAMGLDSCFLLDGIHGHELPKDDADPTLPAAVTALAASFGASPRYTIRRLAW